MNWQDSNAKDTQLLDRCCLAPLDAAVVAGEGGLLDLIEHHNSRAAQVATRVRQLAADRQRLNHFDNWKDAHSADLMSERARIRREAWDALLELRWVLRDRESILRRVEELLDARYHDAEAEHSRVVAIAERGLKTERRMLEKSVPVTAAAHFAGLVATEDSVAASAQRLSDLRRLLDDTAAARRACTADVGAVVARQRELFSALLS